MDDELVFLQGSAVKEQLQKFSAVLHCLLNDVITYNWVAT